MEKHIEIASFEAAAADPYAQFESQDILVLLRIIAELEENAIAQALALKAAKAMQQAETERADANERDADRYRWIKGEYVKSNIFIVKRSIGRDFIMCGSRADFAIDQAMSKL